MFPGLSIDVASIEEDNLRQMSSQSTRDPYLSIGGSVYLAQGYVLRRHGMDVPDTELGTDEGISLLNMSPTDIEILPIQERLGKGSSGSVKKALHRPTRRDIALKEIPLTSEHHLSEVAKELNALRKVAQDAAQWIDVDREEADSGVDVGVQISRTRRLETLGARYLIHMIGAFVRDASANLAMEYMDGSLLALCAPPVVPEPVLACITKMILLGLDYLHRTLHIIHRDIKPSNLLFSRKSGRIKIADFGVSSRADDAHTVGLSFVGTVSYMSPERLNGDDYATAVDVWSLGVTLTELITGVHPFSYLWRRPADTTTNILERSTAEEKFWALLSYFKSKQTLDALIQLPESVNASPELQDFVRVCTMRDAAQRMAAHELLRHPWIVQHTRSSSAEPPDLDHMESYVDDRKERHIILQYLNEREAVGTQNQSGGSSMKVERTEVTGTHPALTPTMPKKSDALCSAIDDILEGI